MEQQRKLVVGLGNPGSKYQNTRHNIGYEVLGELARRHAAGVAPKTAFQGDLVEYLAEGVRVLLLAPTTYMNRSGKSVLAARDFYKIANEDILIICDDMNLPAGKLRVRSNGTAGGQNGLADVIRLLGDDVPRLRMGIGSPPPAWQGRDYVLGKFTKEERTEMDVTVVEAADAVSVWIREGVAHCMNRYN